MIRQATIHDLNEIFDIRLEASERMKNEHINQWQGMHPTKEQFHQDMMHGTCFVYEQDGTIFATATFQIEKELTYASLVDLDIPAMTLHRIAVRNQALHQGIGKAMLAFMEIHAQTLNIHTLYVDTHKDNTKMKHLLKSFQYTFIGIVELPNISSPHREVYRKSLTKC
jgi:N-acetylglutamate synthase-like GNAT family acetyltransferase